MEIGPLMIMTQLNYDIDFVNLWESGNDSGTPPILDRRMINDSSAQEF